MFSVLLGAVIDTALSVTSSVYEVWTHKNGTDRERAYFFRLSGWKRNYRYNGKYTAFCLFWRLYFIIFLCSDHSNITWKLFLIPGSFFRMLQLCCPEPLPALLQFLYQSGVSSGRSIIIRRKKTEEIRNLQLRIFFFFTVLADSMKHISIALKTESVVPIQMLF